MTVEAAIVLPLFCFFAVVLLMPMKLLDTQRRMQTTVELFCEELSLYSYIGQYEEEASLLEIDQAQGEDGALDIDGNLELFSDMAAGVWLQGKLAAYKRVAIVENVQVPDENGDLVLKAVYREQMPFFSGIFNGISVEVAAKRRGWIGYEGKLTEKRAGGEMSEGDVEMVYVGKSMGRYHRDRNCHYISNSYQAVSVEEAKAMSDLSGRRFTACDSCKSDIKANGTVYVTEGGRHYHGNMDCRAMVSYVRKVPIAEVLHLGECSYCGGSKN